MITHPHHKRPIIVAEGSDVILRCKATGRGTLNYRWIRVSGSSPKVVLENKSIRLKLSNITVNDSGEYYCKVNNGRANVSSMGLNVTVKSNHFV